MPENKEQPSCKLCLEFVKRKLDVSASGFISYFGDCKRLGIKEICENRAVSCHNYRVNRTLEEINVSNQV